MWPYASKQQPRRSERVLAHSHWLPDVCRYIARNSQRQDHHQSAWLSPRVVSLMQVTTHSSCRLYACVRAHVRNVRVRVCEYLLVGELVVVDVREAVAQFWRQGSSYGIGGRAQPGNVEFLELREHAKLLHWQIRPLPSKVCEMDVLHPQHFHQTHASVYSSVQLSLGAAIRFVLCAARRCTVLNAQAGVSSLQYASATLAC